MKYRSTENFIIILVSLSSIGLTVESVLMGWEFWVPPLIVIGTGISWAMILMGKPDYGSRKVYYLVYTMLSVFYHGVHESSFFDIVAITSICMVAFSFFDNIYMMNLFLAEYIVLVLMQLLILQRGSEAVIDDLYASRVILHVAIAFLCYSCCIKMINDRIEAAESDIEKNNRIESYNADLEDFLSNISHELRTPINVVNGMSDLLIKRNVGKEPYSIKDAGIRLAYQIDDIQDYTECKRKKLLLEEEDYMSTSLINDVVTSFRLLDNDNKLELVVDMSPSVPTKLRGDIKKLHKIFRHLMENAVKFTKHGGIYIKLYSEPTEYGVNLCIEMEDTGIGMSQNSVESIAEGMYQVNKKRNRSSGGIGLGLFIVYGFAHRMGGFVKIESEKGKGTMVRVTIPQKVADETPSLVLSERFSGDILFHVKSSKYKVPRVRDFYRFMATNLATEIGVPLFSAETIRDIDRAREKLDVSYVFMGQEEYEANPAYFDELSQGDVVVAVSAYAGFKPNPGSRVMIMPKPLYAYPVVKILNEGRNAKNIEYSDNNESRLFTGVKALIVDDEPMNLVVASSLFIDYDMEIDTADSGREAIQKYRAGDYDVVFMDHMMPEMDGVEAMKRIKQVALELDRQVLVVALTANVVSGAREMFIKEGFDGFIAKPINTMDFERVMVSILPAEKVSQKGKDA